ncbi:MAG: prepilin-type N-terminal cleavage/methylation domain-containing protein [Candidatus Methylomirabilales bacterium]
MRKFVKGKEGFTLIEIVLVIVIIAVLAGILIEPLRQGVKSYIGIETRSDLTSQARDATMRMVREMRNIQKKANDKPNITSADATSITFVDNRGTTISFSLSGSTVLRDTNLLADKVSGLDFRYFKGDNTALTTFPLSPADLDAVRRILVILTMQENTETVTMTGQAFLRDLRGL